jgi:hypothetical protein
MVLLHAGITLFFAFSVSANAPLHRRRLYVHNPHGAAVTQVHMVVSSHFDGGCKTPGCGVLAPGEPDKCAKVHALYWSLVQTDSQIAAAG